MPTFLRRAYHFFITHPGLRNSLLLLILFFAARYWYWQRFGLYEDDLTIIPGAMQMNFSQLFNHISDYILQFRGQGRPFHHSFIHLFSNLGYSLGGFNGPYLFGYLILGLNAVLFYLLMRRTAGHTFALLAGLAYTLFSADTTQAYLTCALGIQPSLTLLLLAGHAYLSNRRWLAYPLALLILFSYETPFLVFLGIPLLKKEWNRRLLREWLIHLGIVLLMPLAVHLFRMAHGEYGVVELGLAEMIRMALRQVVVGPFTSLTSYLTRPFEWLGLLSLQLGLVVMAAWLLIGFALHSLPAFEPAAKAAGRLTLSEPARRWLRLLLVGLLMLVCAYPLTFTTPPDALAGRITRAHTAATPGAAVVIGAALCLLLQSLRKAGWQRAATWAAAGWFALLVGFGFTLQMEYVRAWIAEKTFWSDLLPMIPDVQENTVILVEPNVFPLEQNQIAANEWNLPRTLNQIYQYPVEWQNPPRVFRLRTGWDKYILTPDDRLALDDHTIYGPYSLFQIVDPENVILIQAGEPPYRRNQDLQLGESTLRLKTPAEGTPPEYPRGFLYRYLIEQP